MGVVERLEEHRYDLCGHDAAMANADALAPVLAGARARGMADAFDLLGLAAIFLDEDGAALHVSARARRALGGALTVERGQLRASDAVENEALQSQIRLTLAGAPSRSNPLVLAQHDSRPALSLRIVSIDAGDESTQLLRAIILIDRIDPAKIVSLF